MPLRGKPAPEDEEQPRRQPLWAAPPVTFQMPEFQPLTAPQEPPEQPGLPPGWGFLRAYLGGGRG